MSEEMFWIEGEAQVPEEDRDVVNRIALKMLRICGARKREKMILSGKEVEVAALPHPDGEGLIRFDCSVFDEYKRELCVYDTASCHLEAHDFGAREFSLPVILIMALEASFSTEKCRLMSYRGEMTLSAWTQGIGRLMPNAGSTSLLSTRAAHELSHLYGRDNENEFLEYWDSENLNLSPSLRREIQGWIRDFPTAPEVEPEEVENLLSEILTDMVRIWNCRLGDRAFAEEFLAHRQDPNYRKALGLIRSFMYRDLKKLPELTREQALTWMIRKYHWKKDTVANAALLSLLLNHEKRKELFGF